MGWRQLQDGIQAAIVKASGLADDRVIWAYQDAGQQPLTYVSVAISSSLNPGQDGLLSSYDANRPAGQEIKLQVVGYREITIALEVFTAAVADDDDAENVAEKIRTSLLLPSVRDLLTAVAVSPIDTGPVQYAPAIVAAGFRGRATLDIRANAPAPDVFDLTGYIATVTGTITTHDPDSTLPFTAP